jgi:DNA-binding IclR family transcriptional regulator
LVASLATAVGSSAHLFLPSYSDVLCVIHVEGPGAQPHVGLHELIPRHCTAPGRVLLAFRDAWRREALSRPLEACTASTITDAQQLDALLAETRERGWTSEHGQYQPGVGSVAAAVNDSDGLAIAAFAVTTSGPQRVDPESVARDVVSTAQRLTAKLAPPRG